MIGHFTVDKRKKTVQFFSTTMKGEAKVERAATALARTGDCEGAVQVAEMAVAAARRAGEMAMAESIAERALAYREERRWHGPGFGWGWSRQIKGEWGHAVVAWKAAAQEGGAMETMDNWVRTKSEEGRTEEEQARGDQVTENGA